jgi:hypothetical protein
MPVGAQPITLPAWCSDSTPGDVVVHHHHLVDQPVPLLGEHADGRRAAAHPHPLFRTPLTTGGLPGLDDDGGALVDLTSTASPLHSRIERVAGHAAFLLAAAGQVLDAAQRQHLEPYSAGGDMADRLAVDAHERAFGPRWRSVSIFTLTPQ